MNQLKKLEWFVSGYESYIPNPRSISEIERKISDCQIQLFIDVNCKDVQSLVPKFIKIVDLCRNMNYFVNHIEMRNLPIFTSKSKLPIRHVPTIIIKRNEIEIFTIVEKIPEKVKLEYILEKI